jgi:VWFA-related protein
MTTATSLRLRTLLCACVIVAGRPSLPPQAAQGQRAAPPAQRFDITAEIVLVDVTVIDGNGLPVTDLGAGDFRLEVAGKPRPIQAVQFVSASTDGAKPRDPPASPRDAWSSSNTAPSRGRLLLIAVDESHLRIGANRAVLRAAEGLLEQLAPGDLVGVARLPRGDGGVEFTTNRTRVLEGLRNVIGTPGRPRLGPRVYLTEATDFDGQRGSHWQEAIRRECPDSTSPDYVPCVLSLELETRDLLTDHNQRTTATANALELLLERLRQVDTPIDVVLISEGLYVGRDMARLDRVTQLAARARVSVHVVRPAPELFDIQDRGTSPNRSEDDYLLRQGLEQLAGSTRGGYFTAVGSGTGVFQRIATELSGYYLLGFEPTDDDLSGRDRRIKVEVARRGVTVRARATFAIAEREAAPATPFLMLQKALLSPLPTPGLPIRVATFPISIDERGQIRVLVSAEIGAPTREPAKVPLGLIVLDDAGRATVSNLGEAELKPALESSASPGLYVASVVLPPGDYTLRLGSVSPDGQIGATHHAFAAQLRSASGGFNFSDVFVVAAPAPGDIPRPSPSAIIDADRIVAFVQGHHANAASLDRVKITFDVRKSEEAPPLVSHDADPAPGSDASRTFAAAVPADVLPPGEYVVTARITVPDGAQMVTSRPFRVERTVSTAATRTPAVSTARAAPPVPAKLTLPLPRFAVEEVLRPDVVARFLDRLQQDHVPSAAVRALIEQARSGNFTASVADASHPPQDALILTFINGLSALQKRQIAQAMTLFERALRSAPDFVGLAMYLGACHAASGRDREAAGAWQMSLLSEEATAAYQMLVDALLRVGEVQRAQQVLQQAPEAWRSASDRQRREAIAAAAAGQYDVASSALEAVLAEQPADIDLLFLGLQVLYRRHLADPLREDDRARFTEWARSYEKFKGPNHALVAAWERFLKQ